MLWKANRWYDDKMRDDPVPMTLGFFGVVALALFGPVIVHALTGSQAYWIDIAPALLMGVAGIIRAYWLAHACKTYTRDSDG
jgi:hypothetical protein